MEKNGYKILKKYYKLPKLIAADDNNSVVIYEYNESHKKNEGLLVDFFALSESLTDEYYTIFNEYINVFFETIKYVKKGNCKIFFEKRLRTRLKDNVDYIKSLKLGNKQLKLNGVLVDLDVSGLFNDLCKYFNSLGNEWCVISNGDPNDMNISLDGMMFDYTGGGRVPLACEFAVFACYNLIQGEYLSLKYNKKAFKKHTKIYKHLNKCRNTLKSITHKPRRVRISAVEFYAKSIIEPLLDKVGYVKWYDDFKYYFIMKLLAVFKFDKMSKKDILMSLGYAQLFYEAKINDINEFISFIKKIYE